MSHSGMMGRDGIATCDSCLEYLTQCGPAAERECYDCSYADKWGRPRRETSTVGHTEPQWSARQWQSVQQLRAQVNFLSNKVTEMRIEKKKADTLPSAEQKGRVDITNKLYPLA